MVHCRRQGWRPCQCLHAFRHPFFSEVQRGQIDRRRSVHDLRFGNRQLFFSILPVVEGNQVWTDAIVLHKAFQGRRQQFFWYFQQFRCALQEKFLRGVDMLVIDHFIRGKYDAGFDAGGMIRGQPQGLRDAIGGLEVNPVNVPLQLIGILLDGFQGFVAVGLVDLDRQVGADPVTMQEDHDLLDLLLLLPGFGDATSALLI